MTAIRLVTAILARAYDRCSVLGQPKEQIGSRRRMVLADNRPQGVRSDPALKLAQHELADHVHAFVAVIETGNGGKLLTTGLVEYLGVFLHDFFQRLDAIRCKSRA